MQQPPDRPPPERLPDDDGTRTKRHDRLDDQHLHDPHPGDDRLTEADLDEHERERRPLRARCKARCAKQPRWRA
jgi:hypothetical protein